MLYVCPTPIGNMEDITLRVLNTLKKVNYIACEDTRHSAILLNYYDIHKPLISLHEHNEMEKREEIIRLLAEGNEVALVSDAGMPGIQDPGYLLIQAVIEQNIPYTVLPGASAVITAAVASNLAQKEFLFIGFLPRKKSLQLEQLENLKNVKWPIVFYEAPHRIEDTLTNIHQVFENRQISICREISKKFEEYIHTDLDSLDFEKIQRRGEFVIVVQGCSEIQKEYTEEDILQMLKEEMNKGNSKKDAVRIVMTQTKLPKKSIYPLSLEL